MNADQAARNVAIHLDRGAIDAPSPAFSLVRQHSGGGSQYSQYCLSKTGSGSLRGGVGTLSQLSKTGSGSLRGGGGAFSQLCLSKTGSGSLRVEGAPSLAGELAPPGANSAAFEASLRTVATKSTVHASRPESGGKALLAGKPPSDAARPKNVLMSSGQPGGLLLISCFGEAPAPPTAAAAPSESESDPRAGALAEEGAEEGVEEGAGAGRHRRAALAAQPLSPGCGGAPAEPAGGACGEVGQWVRLECGGAGEARLGRASSSPTSRARLALCGPGAAPLRAAAAGAGDAGGGAGGAVVWARADSVWSHRCARCPAPLAPLRVCAGGEA